MTTIFVTAGVCSQPGYRTQVFDQNIKTLQTTLDARRNGLMPVLELNGSDVITISFDELSHKAHSYGYKVIHCNADWTPSGITTSEYLNGYTTADITDYVLSVNTTYLYTHYSFQLPNNEMSFKISGNYLIDIYEDNQVDKPVAHVCFSIVEPRVGINATVRGNTDTELNGRLQQVDFDVLLNGYQIREPNTELKVFVRQNNRLDNQVGGVAPTYVSGLKLSYINNKALIFEGGNEYHRFDISSVYAAGQGVDAIRYNQPHYDAFLFENKIQTSRTFIQDQDVNGRYVINLQRSDADDVEADYMWVRFRLQAPQPFFDGQLYLGGEFNYNLLDEISRLKYDNANGVYYQDVLLKQGGYNYQYWFVPKGTTRASAERVDGSYWQARNEYSIYVYHRPWGERYDRLIGVKNVE